MVQIAHLSTGKLHKYDKTNNKRKCIDSNRQTALFGSTTEYELQTNPQKAEAERDEDRRRTLQCKGTPVAAPTPISGVQRARKLWEVLGTTPPNSPPMATSTMQRGFFFAVLLAGANEDERPARRWWSCLGGWWWWGRVGWGTLPRCFLICSNCLFDSFFGW